MTMFKRISLVKEAPPSCCDKLGPAGRLSGKLCRGVLELKLNTGHSTPDSYTRTLTYECKDCKFKVIRTVEQEDWKRNPDSFMTHFLRCPRPLTTLEEDKSRHRTDYHKETYEEECGFTRELLDTMLVPGKDEAHLYYRCRDCKTKSFISLTRAEFDKATVRDYNFHPRKCDHKVTRTRIVRDDLPG